jgi:hypothetical protein
MSWMTCTAASPVPSSPGPKISQNFLGPVKLSLGPAELSAPASLTLGYYCMTVLRSFRYNCCHKSPIVFN